MLYTSITGQQKKQADSFKFLPSGEYAQRLEKIITECGMDAQKIQLRYSYSQGRIAITMFNTISIDPILCSLFEQDPEAIKIKNIVEPQVIALLPDEQKNRLSKIKEVLTPEVQEFIFKHELGHVFYGYSNKKIVIMGAIVTIAAYLGITTAVTTYQTLGSWAVALGMVVGGLIDMVLSYSSNPLFTAKEEKRADLFAAQYSSSETIEAVADFWEKHQNILDTYKDPNAGLVGSMPSIILSGHYDGKVRAQYLRAALSEKNNFVS